MEMIFDDTNTMYSAEQELNGTEFSGIPLTEEAADRIEGLEIFLEDYNFRKCTQLTVSRGMVSATISLARWYVVIHHDRYSKKIMDISEKLIATCDSIMWRYLRTL